MNCHNGEKYLVEAIKSILKQTFKNWELIFWNNSSNDKSEEIFKLLRIKVKIFLYFKSKFICLKKCNCKKSKRKIYCVFRCR